SGDRRRRRFGGPGGRGAGRGRCGAGPRRSRPPDCEPRHLAARRGDRGRPDRRAMGCDTARQPRQRAVRVPRRHSAPSRRREDRARLLDGGATGRAPPRRLRGHQGRGHLVHQVPRGRARAAPDQRDLRGAGVGRYGAVGDAVCEGRATGQGGHRADDPARSRGKPRGLCGAHRVSLLRPGRAHYGRDSERERGERALRMIVGIGLDVVEVGKVRELLAAQQTFEERVFTPAERDDCAARADKAEALAARLGNEHGAVAVLDEQRRRDEGTMFSKDIKTDARHVVVEFGVSLMDGVARRDFTISAIAYHPIRHEWRDPFHGAEDLEHKLIRSVGDANWRFQEDYLRILRALRFSARFEFRIQPRTLEAAKANVQGLAQLSAERVRDEWFKGIATAKRVSKLLTLWIDVGAARIWLPEIPGGGKRETGNVDKLPRDAVLVTAYLASDPASLLTRLKSSNKDIERARAIGQWRDKYPDPRHLPEVRTWLSQVGAYADDLLALLPGLTVS